MIVRPCDSAFRMFARNHIKSKYYQQLCKKKSFLTVVIICILFSRLFTLRYLKNKNGIDELMTRK